MKRMFTAFAVAAAALAVFTSPAQAASQQLWDACKGNDNDAAIRACTQILAGKETNQNRMTAFESRAIAYHRKGDLDRAIADLTHAIKLNPTYASAFAVRGHIYLQKSDLDRAIADLDRAIELDPKDASAFYTRGRLFHKRRDYDRAIADLDRAIELDPKFANAFRSRGVAYFRKSHIDQAITDLTRAIELDPKHAGTFNNRALAYRDKGELDRAIADFSRAIELDREPKSAPPFNGRGYAYLKQGKLDLARADIQKALELKPDYVEAKAALAEIEQAEAAKKAEAEKPKAVQQAKAEEPRPAEAKPVTPATRPVIATAPLGKRLALVIGNSAYKHTPALVNPKNDAADMAASLKRLGFEVIFEQDLDKRAMDDAFRRFAREVRGADAALFYYAGHAMQFEGVNYLMPVDAQLRDEADVAYEMAKLDDIVADMARMNGVRIAVLDSCRNNPLEEKLKRSISLTRGVAPQRGLARVVRPEGLVVAYSTQAGNVAEDGKGRNSPFTLALLSHIETPGLEVGPLFRRVMGSVKQATGGKQHPELSILFDGEFYFKPGS